MSAAEPGTAYASTRYPCHPERATNLTVRLGGEPEMHRRSCGECKQEYEVVSRFVGEGEAVCEWRPVTRLIGEVSATTRAYL